jgi:hypothetical protein
MLLREDKAQLESFEGRLTTIRVRIVGVAEVWATGYYLLGAGGVSKSFVVMDTLQKIGANARPGNSRLTAKGLFELLGARALIGEWGDCPTQGGESGGKPRPCDLAWAFDLLRQCGKAAVPYFLKQLRGIVMLD